MTSPESDRCPYCRAAQPPGLRDARSEWWRCTRCNFHITAGWLVDDTEDWQLDDQLEVLCPWCGYPAGLLQEPPGQGEFPCGGCDGTLIADQLVTPDLIARDQRSGTRLRKQLLIVLVGLALMAFILAMVVG